MGRGGNTIPHPPKQNSAVSALPPDARRDGDEAAESRAAEAAKAAVGRGLRGDEVVDAVRRAGVVLLPVHLDVARRQARLVAAHAALDAKYQEDKKTYYFYDKTGRAYRIYNPRGLPPAHTYLPLTEWSSRSNLLQHAQRRYSATIHHSAWGVRRRKTAGRFVHSKTTSMVKRLVTGPRARKTDLVGPTSSKLVNQPCNEPGYDPAQQNAGLKKRRRSANPS